MDADRTMHLTAYSYWEIAFIYAFSVLFDRSDIATIHPIPFFTPKILEDALFTDTQDIMDQLMRSFLSNALNRKKIIEPNSSIRLLSEYINAKIRCQDFDLGYNPLVPQEGFNGLSSDLKLKILHALVEWQLQDSTSIRTIVDTLYTSTDNPLVPSPLGYDSQKRAYWQFGASPYVWREKAHLKSGCEWEIVCRDMDELEQFAHTTLEQSNSHKEKKLALQIKDVLVPMLQERQRQQSIKDRAKARKMAARLALETIRELPRRARRKPARYDYSDFMTNIDDDGDQLQNHGREVVEGDDDVWNESDGGRTRSSSVTTSRRQPTRSSGRLHGDDAIVAYMEDMEIDNQQPQSDDDDDGDDDDQSSTTSSSTAVFQSNENQSNSTSNVDVDSNDENVRTEQQPLFNNTKTWPTPPQDMDEDLDIV